MVGAQEAANICLKVSDILTFVSPNAKPQEGGNMLCRVGGRLASSHVYIPCRCW